MRTRRSATCSRRWAESRGSRSWCSEPPTSPYGPRERDCGGGRRRLPTPRCPRDRPPERLMTTPTATPDWLLAKDAALCPCGCIGRRRKGSYVQKTLTGGADLLRQVIFSDDTSSVPGLL